MLKRKKPPKRATTRKGSRGDESPADLWMMKAT